MNFLSAHGRASDAHRPFSLAVALLALVCLAAFASTVRAVEVRELLWGFDGAPRAGCFNPLTIVLHNERAESYEGTLRLTLGNHLPYLSHGVPIVEQIYLSPGSTRHVQLYPYVARETEEWWLSLPECDPIELTPAGLEAEGPVRVVLTARGARRQGLRDVPAFPAEFLPRASGALDSLESVLLDHVPEWDSAQRSAFVAWLAAGGRVHLLANEGGEFPVFDDELSILNTSAVSSPCFLGMIHREELSNREVSAAALGWSEGRSSGAARGQEHPRADLDDFIAVALKDLSTPDHHWGLIWLLAILYFVLVWLVNWHIGRKYRDYRLAIGFLLVCAAAFSWLFFHVGRRGFGEGTRLDTIVYAADAGNGILQITQWGQLFVTESARFTIEYPAPISLFGTLFRIEYVQGAILPSGSGALSIAMPLFSHREFVRRSALRGAPLLGRVLSQPTGSALEGLRVEPGPGFPAEPSEIFVHGPAGFQWARLAEGVIEVYGAPETASMTHPEIWNYGGNRFASARYARRSPYGNEERGGANEEHVFSSLCFDVAQCALEKENFPVLSVVPRRPDRAWVDVFVRTKELLPFAASGGRIREIGQVIYHATVSLNDE